MSYSRPRAATPRSKEIVPWDCPVIQQHGQRANEFYDQQGLEELWIVCKVEACQFTEIYVRNPEPREMACKVIGSVCVNIRDSQQRKD